MLPLLHTCYVKFPTTHFRTTRKGGSAPKFPPDLLPGSWTSLEFSYTRLPPSLANRSSGEWRSQLNNKNCHPPLFYRGKTFSVHCVLRLTSVIRYAGFSRRSLLLQLFIFNVLACPTSCLFTADSFQQPVSAQQLLPHQRPCLPLPYRPGLLLQ